MKLSECECKFSLSSIAVLEHKIDQMMVNFVFNVVCLCVGKNYDHCVISWCGYVYVCLFV